MYESTLIIELQRRSDDQVQVHAMRPSAHLVNTTTRRPPLSFSPEARLFPVDADDVICGRPRDAVQSRLKMCGRLSSEGDAAT